MTKRIDPRTLKGFRDYPPELMIPREHLLDIARRVYRSYGFAPIDTPALEYTEILLGKGGETAALLRALDKLPKIGKDAVCAEMAEKAKVSATQAERVLALAGMTGDNGEMLDRLAREFGSNEKAAEGIRRLRELLAVA